jgi:hypothetical protein
LVSHASFNPHPGQRGVQHFDHVEDHAAVHVSILAPVDIGCNTYPDVDITTQKIWFQSSPPLAMGCEDRIARIQKVSIPLVSILTPA